MSVAVSNDVVMEQKLVQERKRARDHKHKWAHGDDVATPGHPSRRPMKLRSRSKERGSKPPLEWPGRQSHPALVWQSDSDSSVDDCFQRASTDPEPDAGISYSFDAPRGPHQGSQILSMALAKAVEKFEVKATEKLVKEEYEVIAQDKEDPDGYIAYEDDFELV